MEVPGVRLLDLEVQLAVTVLDVLGLHLDRDLLIVEVPGLAFA
jgi:hypothetical protein